MIAFQIYSKPNLRAVYRIEKCIAKLKCEHYRAPRSALIENILRLSMLFDLFLSI